jgi:simple sugar transport system substrate-binding protein
MRTRALLLLLLAVGLTGPARAADSKLKACFLYVGPVGDIGWNYAHDEARKLAQKALPWLETQ